MKQSLHCFKMMEAKNLTLDSMCSSTIPILHFAISQVDFISLPTHSWSINSCTLNSFSCSTHLLHTQFTSSSNLQFLTMAKSLFLALSIFLPLFLSLTSTHAQLLQPAIVPSAACGNVNIIPGLSSPAMPLWPSPYPAIRPNYAASPWASPSICSNIAAISPYPACGLASPYAYSNVAAISPLAAYNVNPAIASPVLNAPALNLPQANQYMVNQLRVPQLLNQQQANWLLHQQQANQFLSQMEANQLLNQLQANQALNQEQANQFLSAVQANQLLNAEAYAPCPASTVVVV